MLLKPENTIKIIATDFDGILTDGCVYYSSHSHEELKKISFKDIMGISLAVKNGYRVAIISGEKNQIIDKIAGKFSLEDVHQGIRDKLAVLHAICEKYSVPPENICYLGDDVNDIAVLERVGFALTVPDAHCKVKKLEGINITDACGGNGAFREVIDFLLDN